MEDKPKKNICFISSLYSKYKDKIDNPGFFIKKEEIEVDGNNNLKCDYLLFTNLNEECFNTSWNIITLPINIDKFQNYIVLSRYPKFMLWKIMEDYHFKFDYSYDIIVYCDAFLSPSNTYDWSKIYNFLIKRRTLVFDKDKLNIIQSYHHYKKIRNGGIFEDAKMIITSNKDHIINVIKTLKFFKDQGYGSFWLKKKGYIENTVFCYDFQCLKTRKFLQDFWNLYKISELTYRDQIIWNFLLIKQKKLPIIFELEKDICDNLDILNEDYYTNEFRKTMKDIIFLKTGKIIGHNKNHYF